MKFERRTPYKSAKDVKASGGKEIIRRSPKVVGVVKKEEMIAAERAGDSVRAAQIAIEMIALERQ